MTTQSHEPGDDRRLSEAHAAHHDSATSWPHLPFAHQDLLQTLEQPLAADERVVRAANAGNLEQQGFEHDVDRLIRCESSWKGRG